MSDDWWLKYRDPATSIHSGGEDSWWLKYRNEDPVYASPTEPTADTTTAISPPEEEVGPWRAGLASSTADLMTGVAKVEDMLGFHDTAKETEEGAQERYKTAAKFKPSVGSYEDIYVPGDIGKTIGNVGRYAYETLAQSAPQMGAIAGAGLLGAAAAPAAIPGALAGFGAAALADYPFFFGQNLKEQQDNGKQLSDTSASRAALAAVPQSFLDVALGEVLPGVGREVGGGLLARAAKKGLEGAAIEGTSEGLQQAIQIAQADPDKLWQFDPDTQKEIFDAAIRGGLLGGTVGGVSGAGENAVGGTSQAHGTIEPGTREAPPTPTDKSLSLVLPGQVDQIIGTEAPPTAPITPETVPPPEAGRGEEQPLTLPTERETAGPQPVAQPTGNVEGVESSTPPPVISSEGPNTQPIGTEAEPQTVDTSPEVEKAPGQRVYDWFFQKLLAAGTQPPEAIAKAKLARSIYDEQGRRHGTDAWQEFQNQNWGTIVGPDQPVPFQTSLRLRPDGSLDPTDIRGAASMPWSWDAGHRVNMLLTSSQSPTTFLHELMHVRLEAMREGARVSPDEAFDLRALLNWRGKTSPNQLTTADHEAIARGFEKYINEGKAPTPELQSVFEKFVEWIKNMFQSARNYKVRMSPAARDVYARILGGDVGREEASAAPTMTAEEIASQPRMRGWLSPTLMSIERNGIRGFPLNEFDVPKIGMFADKGATPTTQGELGREFVDENKQGLGDRLNSALGAVKSGVNWLKSPLHNLPGQRDYMILRMLTQGKADDITRFAQKMVAPLREASADDVKNVYDYLTTRNAPTSMIQDEKVREAAKNLKAKINQISAALVSSGKLSVDAAARFHDQYLPRLYLKYLMENKGLRMSGIKISPEDYLKHRGELSEEERAALGEVKDPGILGYFGLTRPLRDLAVSDMMHQISLNPEWTWQASLVNWRGKAVTPFYLRSEASDIRARIPKMQDEDQKAMAEKVAQEMEATAAQNNPTDQDYDHTRFVQLPKSRTYGDLQGAVVRKEIANDIKGMSQYVDPNAFMERLLGERGSALSKLNALWKESKVVWNPPTQIRNFVSNHILLWLDGVPINWQLRNMGSIAKELAGNGKYWQIARKYGIGSSTMTESEIRKFSDRFLEEMERQGKTGAWAPAMKALGNIREKSRDLYQWSEHFGKVMRIKYAMEHQGMDEGDAALAANNALFDYSLVTPSVRYLRNAPLGMPFVTFTSKVIPFLAEKAMTPQGALKMAGAYALSQAIPYLVGQYKDIDKKDVDTLQKSLSRVLGAKGDMYLLPFKDQNGRWQFADLGYFFPWQQITDMTQNLAQGNFGDAARSVGLLSSPTVNAISALTTGIDSFTGKPIMDPRDPPNEQARSLISWLWGQAAPPILSQYGAAGKLLENQTGTGLNRYGEPGYTTGQSIARALGVNIYPVIPDAQRARNIKSMMYEIQEEKSRMNQSLRDQSITPARRQALIQSFREDLQRKYRDMQKYIAETSPSPKLRAASQNP